MRSQI